MEAIGELFGFIGAITDEIGTILMGDDEASAPAASNEIRPIVIAGPSGVGKGTLIGMLMKEYPNHFGFSVSHTTRSPRPGEKDGKDYHFTDRATMAAMIEAGEFIESADVHGNYYGTSKAAVHSVFSQGKICILDIDVQGVQSVKKAQLQPEPRYIFVQPPSMDELERRLRSRNTETEDRIQRRLVNAVNEIAYADENNGENFDHVIINEDLNAAFEEIKAAIADILAAVDESPPSEAPAPPPAVAATPKKAAAPAPAAAAPAPAAAPTLAVQLAQKEAEMEAAVAAKDRAKQRVLLGEIEALESAMGK